MTSNYVTSIKVNEALESYGAKTHGSLERRMERLKRFTDLKNKSYAQQIKQDQEFLELIDKRYGFTEEHQESNIPVYLSPASPYNLRSRSDPDRGMKLLLTAIENGYVTTKRG